MTQMDHSCPSSSITFPLTGTIFLNRALLRYDKWCSYQQEYHAGLIKLFPPDLSLIIGRTRQILFVVKPSVAYLFCQMCCCDVACRSDRSKSTLCDPKKMRQQPISLVRCVKNEATSIISMPPSLVVLCRLVDVVVTVEGAEMLWILARSEWILDLSSHKEFSIRE